MLRPTMWVFPLVAALIALVFAVLLIRQFASRRRPFQGTWALALLMFATASFAMFLGVLNGWSSAEYRTYWLFGAILNVPFLAMGEAYLLIKRRRIADVAFIAVLFLAGFATSQVRTAPINAAALSTDLPLGKHVFGSGSLAYRLAQLYAYPAFIFLVAGCVWSAWQMRGRPELLDRFIGTLGVAVGATIVAIGSGVGAGFDIVPVFSIGLAAGIAIMFWGFLRASRQRSPRPTSVPTSSSSGRSSVIGPGPGSG